MTAIDARNPSQAQDGTEAESRIITGAKKALAFARGEAPAPRIFIAGHYYVPEAERDAARETNRTLNRRLGQLERAVAEKIEAALPERRTLGRALANAGFYMEHDRANQAEAERDAAKATVSDLADQKEALLRRVEGLEAENERLRGALEVSYRLAFRVVDEQVPLFGSERLVRLHDDCKEFIHKYAPLRSGASARAALNEEGE